MLELKTLRRVPCVDPFIGFAFSPDGNKASFSWIGGKEAGVSSSIAQMVSDNELAGSILRTRRGLGSTVDVLAVDFTATASTRTRNFLGQKHTIRNLKSSEVFLTHLAKHQVLPLESGQEIELDAILSAAEKELSK